jgi:hypothetical protein
VNGIALDRYGQVWCLVRVTRQDGTEFCDIVPGPDDDLAILGVFAWALFPLAKEIHYKNVALTNPVQNVELSS